MNALIKKVESWCLTHRLFDQNETVIIGLSGGPDSIFLLHVLHILAPTLSLHLVAAHLDHGWRKESIMDKAFCAKQAEQYGVPFVSGHARDFEIETSEQDGSLEAQGRAARRAFFEQTRQHYHAQKIALGHHADDQIETFFIRLFRGAGISGLGSIRPSDGVFTHPLLPCTKMEILDFLNENRITFLTDTTNSDNRFLRNRIRHELIPCLKKCDARAEGSIHRTIELCAQADVFLQEEIATWLKEHHEQHKGLPIQKILELNPFFRNQLILTWLIKADIPFTPSQNLIEEIVRFLGNTKSSSHTLYQTWRIIKKRCYAYIQKDQ